jgi:hypothetical protein
MHHSIFSQKKEQHTSRKKRNIWLDWESFERPIEENTFSLRECAFVA